MVSALISMLATDGKLNTNCLENNGNLLLLSKQMEQQDNKLLDYRYIFVDFVNPHGCKKPNASERYRSSHLTLNQKSNSTDLRKKKMYTEVSTAYTYEQRNQLFIYISFFI